MRRVLVLVVVLAGGCLRTAEFRCEISADCDRGGVLGTCQSVGYCSFPDPGCEGGQRFAELSGSLSSTCVATDGTFAVGGTLSGLTGSVILTNNGDSLTLTGNGAFTFGVRLSDGASYGVAVAVQPAAQTCTVTGGSGAIAGADVTDVTVTCGAVTDAEVLCSTGVSCNLATEVCCFDRDTGEGVCQGSGVACATQRVECDSAEDCGGGMAVCCAVYANQNNLRDVTCEASAASCLPPMMGRVELFCDPAAGAAACPGGMTCTGTPTTPGPGFQICQ